MKKCIIFALLVLSLIIVPVSLMAAPGSSIGEPFIAAAYPTQTIVQGDITVNSPEIERQLANIEKDLAVRAAGERQSALIFSVAGMASLLCFGFLIVRTRKSISKTVLLDVKKGTSKRRGTTKAGERKRSPAKKSAMTEAAAQAGAAQPS
jgi:hypothetical protein